MVRTARDALVTALDNLEKKGLKKFRNKLNDWPIKEGFNRIPKGQLEDTDPEDIANLIRKFYQDAYGIQVALGVLEAIDERDVAAELRADLRNVVGFVLEEQSKASGPVATGKDTPPVPEPREHFVIAHREALISRMSLVSPLLDTLLQKKLLTDEPYDDILSKPTPQAQMRALYSYVRSWGDADKDIFYAALKEHNAPLIRDLEKA